MLNCGIPGTTREHAPPRWLENSRIQPPFRRSIYSPCVRLNFAKLSREQRHPLLLDGRYHFTKLLILQSRILLHHLGVRIILAELREEFWILRPRQTIKQVLHPCLPCRIANGLPGGEIEAPLPTDRITPISPFAVTGIDYAGPLFFKVGNTLKKFYIALFTCATTRAVHLELCLDMSTDKFILALHIFTGRRGLPNNLHRQRPDVSRGV